jgi:hypothetical protein
VRSFTINMILGTQSEAKMVTISQSNSLFRQLCEYLLLVNFCWSDKPHRVTVAHASLGKEIVVHSGEDHTLHNADSGHYICSYKVPRHGKVLPVEAAFIEHGTEVVCGSDHGLIYVFNKVSGHVVDQLRHEESGLNQVIAVSVD